MAWFVYLIECTDGSLYTGIAIDVAARYAAHACGKGARYTRSHPPARLLASFEYPDRSSATIAEYRIKQLSVREKRELCRTGASPADWRRKNFFPEESTAPVASPAGGRGRRAQARPLSAIHGLRGTWAPALRRVRGKSPKRIGNAFARFPSPQPVAKLGFASLSNPRPSRAALDSRVLASSSFLSEAVWPSSWPGALRAVLMRV